MNMSYEDLILEKDTKGSMDGGKVDNSASDRWSTEVEEIFDIKYHGWLGEKLVGGAWTRDKYLNRMMNESCASYLISQITSCFNKNINFSVLEDIEIRWMISQTVNNITDVLTQYYIEFGIKPQYLSSIIDEVWTLTYGLLKIPFMGGMREHIGNKNRTIINKQERTENAF